MNKNSFGHSGLRHLLHSSSQAFQSPFQGSFRPGLSEIDPPGLFYPNIILKAR